MPTPLGLNFDPPTHPIPTAQPNYQTGSQGIPSVGPSMTSNASLGGPSSGGDPRQGWTPTGVQPNPLQTSHAGGCRPGPSLCVAEGRGPGSTRPRSGVACRACGEGVSRLPLSGPVFDLRLRCSYVTEKV